MIAFKMLPEPKPGGVPRARVRWVYPSFADAKPGEIQLERGIEAALALAHEFGHIDAVKRKSPTAVDRDGRVVTQLWAHSGSRTDMRTLIRCEAEAWRFGKAKYERAEGRRLNAKERDFIRRTFGSYLAYEKEVLKRLDNPEG